MTSFWAMCDAYVHVALPLSVLGLVAGGMWGATVGDMTLAQRGKTTSLSALTGFLSGLAWPAVWIDKVLMDVNYIHSKISK